MRRRRLVKDNAAEADLVGIWLYSFDGWGEGQADRYLDGIEAGLRRISMDPLEGESREGLRAGYWSVSLEHHVAFYTFTDGEVRLRRVLHGAMDPGRHIQR